MARTLSVCTDILDEMVYFLYQKYTANLVSYQLVFHLSDAPLNRIAHGLRAYCRLYLFLIREKIDTRRHNVYTLAVYVQQFYNDARGVLVCVASSNNHDGTLRWLSAGIAIAVIATGRWVINANLLGIPISIDWQWVASVTILWVLSFALTEFSLSFPISLNIMIFAILGKFPTIIGFLAKKAYSIYAVGAWGLAFVLLIVIVLGHHKFKSKFESEVKKVIDDKVNSGDYDTKLVESYKSRINFSIWHSATKEVKEFYQSEFDNDIKVDLAASYKYGIATILALAASSAVLLTSVA